jgi:antitoxin component YwqK of YwqJK toxin-antitoxin module
MKFQICIYFLLLSSYSFAQSVVFFGKSDSCKIFSEENKKDTVFVIKEVNRCENRSTIQQVKFEKGRYSRNGFYSSFYDTSFSKQEKTGFFKNGIETGTWKEFFSNGQLKCQGTCKILKLVQSLADPKRILIIDTENPGDTLKIGMDFKLLRSIVEYHYYPPFERKGIMLPAYYSAKVGTWLYFSEAGTLTKKETYKNGMLLKSE